MKRFILTIAALAMVFVSCGQNKKSQQNNNQEEKQMKTLLAYFSATGTTKALAENVANTTG